MAAEEWRKLQVGDRIRFVAMPTEFSRANCHEDTVKAYRTLISLGRAVRVCKLDEWSVPWIRFRLRLPDGRWEHHRLLINHDGWVRVRPRKSSV